MLPPSFFPSSMETHPPLVPSPPFGALRAIGRLRASFLLRSLGCARLSRDHRLILAQFHSHIEPTARGDHFIAHGIYTETHGDKIVYTEPTS